MEWRVVSECLFEKAGDVTKGTERGREEVALSSQESRTAKKAIPGRTVLRKTVVISL